MTTLENAVTTVEKGLDELGVRWHATGSRPMGCAGPTSDYDYAILINNSWPRTRCNLEAAICMELYPGGSINDMPLTESWKDKSEVFNFILIYDEDIYNSWHTAFKLSDQLQLHSKEHRIAMFDYWKEQHEAIECESQGTEFATVGGSCPF